MKTKSSHLARGGVIQLLLALMTIGVLLVLSAGALVYVSVRPSADFRTLQNAVLDELPSRPNARVAVRAPRLLIDLARTGLSFVDNLGPEAQLALKAVHGGQVGIYTLREPVSGRTRARILHRADAALAGRDWSRVVTVLDEDQMVMVYVPAGVEDPSEARFLVMVQHEQELILAGADGDLRPLFELVTPHIDGATAELRRELR